MTSLEAVSNDWDNAAQRGAMEFILTTGHQWDANAFFETGRQEIGDCLSRLDQLGLRGSRRLRALDFGCGIGRLSQALADHYQRVDGVDMAPAMLQQARAHNRHSNRVRYTLNGPRLRYRKGTFDLVYTNITLQHMPQPFAHIYIQEFIRVLHPDGVAVFEIPDGPDVPHPEPCLSMWGTPRAEVERLVAGAGGEVLDAEVLSSSSWECYRYAARRTS